MNRAVPGAVALVVLMGSGAGALDAQQWTFGNELVVLRWTGFDMVGGCYQNRGMVPGAAVFGGRHILRGLSLVATARIHYALSDADPSCARVFPTSGEGTYVFQVGENPLVHTFVAADLRAEYAPHLPWFTPMLAVGGGSIFWNGATAPYGLLAAGLQVYERPVKISLLVEHQRLGLKLDQVQQTFALDPMSGYLMPVSSTDLGYARFWKSATLYALRFDFAVRTPR